MLLGMDAGSVLLGIFGLWQGARNLAKGLANDEADKPRPKGKALIVKKGMKTEMHEVRSLDERVKHIIKMIQKGRHDPRVRSLTVQIISRRCGGTWCTPEKDWKAEATAVFEELRKRYYRYVRDTYGTDLFQHPRRTLEFGGGDCDDASILVASMLGSIGFRCWLRVIQTVEASDWNHIYVVAEIPETGGAAGREGGGRAMKMPLDLSVAKPAGWEAPKHLVKRVKDYKVP